jgi:hypothetical protein
LIRRFPNADHLYKWALGAIVSNGGGRIWEYESLIVPAAKEELAALEPPPPPAPVPVAPPVESESPEPDSYTVSEAVEDLRKAFFPEEYPQTVKRIGRRIVAANFPEPKTGPYIGDGMHQVYQVFHDRFPAYAMRLSFLWDGIGDWAD